MDELKSMSVYGGSDLFLAGTYKISDATLPHPVKVITPASALVVTSMRHRLPSSVNKVSTITITGTSGTAYISLGELKLLVTFATDLDTTAANFVTAYAAALLPRGIVVTSGTATIIFTSTKYLFATPTIANATGDLAGSVVTTGADGLVVATKTFFGDVLADGIDIYCEYPVEEIVIASGSAILHFIK
jgi:hypothetical protein